MVFAFTPPLFTCMYLLKSFLFCVYDVCCFTLFQTYDVKIGPIETTPTFGQPSKDTHFLRDDEVSVDQPLQTVFVDSPAKLRQTADGMYSVCK
jgi:hypothetical protein